MMLKRLSLLLLMFFSNSVLANPVDMALTDLEGRQFSLSDYRGKWVVLNYWATWCPPCLQEIPELVYFHEEHKAHDGVVIGIDMEQLPQARLREFIDDNFITYQVVPLSDEPVMFEQVSNYPTTYLIDPEGIVVAKHVGAVTAEAIEQFIGNHLPAGTQNE